MNLAYTIISIFVFPNISFADQPSPPAVSNGIFSDNKEYIYVTWINEKDKEALAASSNDNSAIKIQKRDFPKEGLYKYKSKAYQWVLDKSERDSSKKYYPLDGGIYLIKLGDHLPGTANDLAFSYYKRGKLIKSYKISDVCNDEQMYFNTSSHFIWKYEDLVDNKKKLYSFYSCKKKMIIDVTSGKFTSTQDVSDNSWQNKDFSSP